MSDGQRIAQELAAIRALLGEIAGVLFQIASGEKLEDDRERETYMDGTPRT